MMMEKRVVAMRLAQAPMPEPNALPVARARCHFGPTVRARLCTTSNPTYVAEDSADAH